MDQDISELQAYRVEMAGDLAQLEQALEEMRQMETGVDGKGGVVLGEN